MSSPRILYWFPVLLAVAHAFWFRGTGPVDDDYICYRYAQNLVAGDGLVFNLGERFEGFTTPLWVLLVAGWQMLGGTGPGFAVGAGVAAWILTVACLSVHAFRNQRSPWPAWFVAAAPAMAWHAHAGLGTTVIALSLLGAWMFGPRAPWRAGLCLAVACAMRQEFVLFVLPWLAFAQGPMRFKMVAPAAVGLGAWTVFRWVYYGRILPMTYGAKKLPIGVDLEYGAQYLLDATLSLGWLIWLGLLAWRVSREHQPALRAWGAGIFVHTLYVVWVGGDFMQLARFFVPVFPLLVVCAWPALHLSKRVLPAVALAGLLLMQWNQVGTHEASRETRILVQQGFKQRWQRLGEHFGAQFPRDTKVAISPIGAFAWASGLHVVDILGLTNDSVIGVEPDLSIHVKGHHRANFDWVMQERPEFVILGNGARVDPASITFNPWEAGFFRSLQDGGVFAQEYRQASMDVGDGMPLDLFIRRDQPLPSGTQWVRP